MGTTGRTSVAVLTIALLAFLTYADVLGYFFTSTDTLTLVDTSRVSSAADVAALFGKPLMDGAKSEGCARFYRPITALTYSLDYHNWGLNPFGYHLTDLSLHVLASVLVYFVVAAVLPGEGLVAWLSAAIFTTHPILAETVPGVAPRQEILVTLLMLGSLVLFLRSRLREKGRGLYLGLSCLVYLFALGAKEIAVVLPLAVAAYALASGGEERGSAPGRLRAALRLSFPYLAVTAGFVVLRTWVLQGLGGYTNLFGPLGMLRAALKSVPGYFLDLLYPLDVLVSKYAALFSTRPGHYGAAGLVVTLGCLLALGLLARGALSGLWRGNAWERLLGVALAGGAALCLTAIVAYPAWSGALNRTTEAAYHGQLARLPADAASRLHELPLAHYLAESRDIAIRFLAFAALAMACGLALLWRRHSLAHYLSDVPRRRFVAVMVALLCSPLLVYVATATFYHRCMYPSAVPFAALLALALVDGLRALGRRMHEAAGLRSALVPLAGSALSVALAVGLLGYSPLVGGYGEWKESGLLASRFLHEISDVASKVPDGAVIEVYDYPQRIAAYRSGPYQVKECGYGNEFSTNAWLHLTRPGNRVKVRFRRRAWPRQADPGNLRLQLEAPGGGEGSYVVYVTFPGGARGLPGRGVIPASSERAAVVPAA